MSIGATQAMEETSCMVATSRPRGEWAVPIEMTRYFLGRSVIMIPGTLALLCAVTYHEAIWHLLVALLAAAKSFIKIKLNQLIMTLRKKRSC